MLIASSVTVIARESKNYWELILSVLTLAVAIIALFYTNRAIETQKSVDLFKERYYVYETITRILDRTMLFDSNLEFNNSYITSFWFGLFYDLNQDIYRIHTKIRKVKEELKAVNSNDPLTKKQMDKQEKLKSIYLKKQNELMGMCYPIMLDEISVLKRAKLLFGQEIMGPINELIEVYKDSVLRFQYDDNLDDLIERWKTIHRQFNDQEIISKMESYISFDK